METDKRTDKQQKVAFDKGIQKGAAVVNNENLNNHAIKIELNQLELKYKLKELDAKLITEKEDMQTWMLSGKLEEYKGTKTIERKPTKAESEEEVSEADRKLHERIAAEVKAQLEAKGKSTEGVETFEEFYGLLQSEAVMLQKKYQPQLRDGIKIAVDLVNQVQQDKKDGDVDVELEIAPNDKKNKLSITPDLDVDKEENNSDSLDDNIDTEIGKVVEFNVDGHDHKIWIEEQGGSVEVMMASKATPVEDKIKVWGKQIEALDKDDENFSKVTSLYNLVVQCYNSTNIKAIDLAKKAAKAEAEQEKKRSLIRNEGNLKKKLFRINDF